MKLRAGIDIGATNIKFGLVDGEGGTCYRGQIATPRNASAEELFEKVTHCGEQLLVEADEIGAGVDTLGVGSPGAVNMKTGVIQGTCPNIPGWVGFHLRERLKERLNLKVLVDNDANCAALAEHRFGAGRGFDNIICLTIGTGIGGGLILNGKIYRGKDYSAGEIGHLLILGDGSEPPRKLEELVSSRAILARLRDKLADNSSATSPRPTTDPEQLTIKKLFHAARKGDETALEVIGHSARILGVALAGLVNVFNPELIILGGGVAEGGGEFIERVREFVQREALPNATEALAVVPAKLGNAAGFIGAAHLLENDN